MTMFPYDEYRKKLIYIVNSMPYSWREVAEKTDLSSMALGNFAKSIGTPHSTTMRQIKRFVDEYEDIYGEIVNY